MKVYPVNAMEDCRALTTQVHSYSNINELWNKYIELQVEFSQNNIDITFSWNKDISINTFIIGNTNAQKGKLFFYYKNDLFWEKHFEIDEYIKIIVNKDENDNKITSSYDTVKLQLEGIDNIKIGYIFMGEEWTLPRFVISPSRQIQLRNESNRTFSGQVIGTPQETLKTFKANFARIEQEYFKVIDEYINGVQSVIPHIIDPYYEAHDKFPPMFCTLTEFGAQEKRDENGFYWNFSMSWEEAK